MGAYFDGSHCINGAPRADLGGFGVTTVLPFTMVTWIKIQKFSLKMQVYLFSA
jgi:hypothetical protein